MFYVASHSHDKLMVHLWPFLLQLCSYFIQNQYVLPSVRTFLCFTINQSESPSVARSVVCLFSQLVGRSIGRMHGHPSCLVRQLVSRPAVGQSKIRSATNDQTVGQLDSQVVRQLNRQIETNEVRQSGTQQLCQSGGQSACQLVRQPINPFVSHLVSPAISLFFRQLVRQLESMSVCLSDRKFVFHSVC